MMLTYETVRYITSLNLISHVLETRKFVMAILHWKQGLLCDKNVIKLVLKNVIKLAKGSLNNIFQDSYNKILSQQLTRDRSYISQVESSKMAKRFRSCQPSKTAQAEIGRYFEQMN